MDHKSCIHELIRKDETTKLADMKKPWHDCPCHVVGPLGFLSFVNNFTTVQGDLFATYLREKQSIQRLIEGMPGSICLTLDLRKSSQNDAGYVFVTGQFIDSDWKMHKKLLNVVIEPYPQSDSAFSHAVSTCLSNWNMEGRLFSLTLNQPLNETEIDSLRGLLSVKNPLILDGQLLLQNCLARFLTNIAQAALKAIQGTVSKVRDCVKHVTTSELLAEKFQTLRQQLGVRTTETLALDDENQWNTTYKMLNTALALERVFSCLDNLHPDFCKGPRDVNWELVRMLCAYLQQPFQIANLLSSSTAPMPSVLFFGIWNLVLDLKGAARREDPCVRSLTEPMKEIFDKYWKNCYLILAMAVIMDPQYKMELVAFSLEGIFGDEAATYINIVNERIHQLFLEYVEEANIGTGRDVKQETSQQSMSELDQYLKEPLSTGKLDVLEWWRVNKGKYPSLAKMACDILTIPLWTVPPEAVFDTTRKEMDSYGCSLRPEMVEILFCAKDWFPS